MENINGMNGYVNHIMKQKKIKLNISFLKMSMYGKDLMKQVEK